MPRPRKFDESDVIAAARDAFWTRGYGATSVDDLAAATGLGKGSLYGAFGDKHGLFIRALDDYITTSLDTVYAQLRGSGYGAYERLTRHIRWQASAAATDKARRGCMMARTAAELGSTDDDVETRSSARIPYGAARSPTPSPRRSETATSIPRSTRRHWPAPC